MTEVHREPNLADAATRRSRAAIAGHQADEPTARAALHDPDPRVRATGLGALARMGRLSPKDLDRALVDDEATVRRRACELSATRRPRVRPLSGLLARLHDDDAMVVETAAWALGELAGPTKRAEEVAEALSPIATSHADPLAREAAVAALGAIGHAAGRDAILAATRDKPAIRRRAVLALAPFDGPEVEAAIDAALADRDWQVRQAAEDLRRD